MILSNVSVDLGAITQDMRLKFSVIVKSNEVNQKFNNNAVTIYNVDGTEYMKITPNPYITIDISKSMDKKDGYAANNSITLNRMRLFQFRKELMKMLKYFSTSDLFYYKNNKLILNDAVASKCYVNFRSGNKVLRMQYAVITDSNELDTSQQYEGVIFFINTIDYYVTLTHDELEYLYNELSNINMTHMAISLINTYYSCKHNDVVETKTLPNRGGITEKTDIVNDTTPLPAIKQSNTIPDI